MILADTDVLIDYLSGAQPIRSQMEDFIEREQIKTTAISCFELLSGAREGKRGDAARRLLNCLEVLPLDRASAACAAVVRRKLDQTGQSIGMADSLIAGIALEHGLALFTRNRSHFERVDDLKLVDSGGPTAA